ncbi:MULTISPECIES: hypothetical protein [unclassified Microcoleus]|nr:MULTISPECIES: hypothetical protein [unclassified Microcoleus]
MRLLKKRFVVLKRWFLAIDPLKHQPPETKRGKILRVIEDVC